MSRRTADANKAIKLAWEREQKLVREGKGTRDWTREQQQDILNPEKGKAYDENGRAFQGQHMKSVAEYPEYQGDPDNIQFLTVEEHLEAHKGNWQNPTNWYYAPVTKEFFDFGDGGIIPCEIIELSDPFVEIIIANSDKGKSDECSMEKEKLEPKTNFDSSDIIEEIPPDEKQPKSSEESFAFPIPNEKEVSTGKKGFFSGLKKVGRFIIDHPKETIEIAGVVAGGIATVIKFSKNNNNTNGSNSSGNGTAPIEPDIVSKIVDIIEETEEVSASKQRYHTKNGVIWKDKDPYPRRKRSK